jgi:hypothetical protein
MNRILGIECKVTLCILKGVNCVTFLIANGACARHSFRAFQKHLLQIFATEFRSEIRDLLHNVNVKQYWDTHFSGLRVERRSLKRASNFNKFWEETASIFLDKNWQYPSVD